MIIILIGIDAGVSFSGVFLLDGPPSRYDISLCFLIISQIITIQVLPANARTEPEMLNSSPTRVQNGPLRRLKNLD